MGHLSLALLGPFQATLDGKVISNFESDKARALLAYLAVEANQPHRREKLAGLFWPERPEREARANLRYTLSNLRKTIGDRDPDKPILCATRQTILLDMGADITVDVAVFQERAGENSTAQDESQLSKLGEAVELYRGEFLEGFSLAESQAFSEWLLIKREQLNRLMLTALRQLALFYELHGEYSRALPYAWRQVDLEPWQEEAHRQVMSLLASTGQRSAALAQYEACRQALATELDVEPARETTMLYEQIRDGEWEVRQQAQVEPPSQATGREDSFPPEKPGEAKPGMTGRANRSRLQSNTKLLVIAGLLLIAIVSISLFVLQRSGVIRNLLFTTPTPIVQSGQPDLSDGKIVAPCGSDPPTHICIIDPRNEATMEMIDTSEYGHVHSTTWAPDGERIAFSAALPGESEYHLYVVSPDGSNLNQITHDSPTDIFPAWSPDGESIAFIRGPELWIIDQNGVEDSKLWGASEQTEVVGIGWSGDSHRIAMAVLPHGDQPSGMEIWIIDREGDDAQMLRGFDEPIVFALLAWSPDGRQLVCHCAFPDIERGLLFNVDGSGEVQRLIQEKIPVSWFHTFWPQWGSGD